MAVRVLAMTIIHLHRAPAAKRHGVGIAAYLAAKGAGLSPIQCDAIRSASRRDLSAGCSPAAAVSNAWARVRAMQRKTPA